VTATRHAARRASAAPAVVVLALLAGAAVAAPEASFTLLDPGTGEPVVVQPGAGVLHLVFFATGCPPCVEEREELAELEARWGERGYRLVIVAVANRHTPSRLSGFAAERDPPGRLLFDAEGVAQKRWKAERLPEHVLLDAEGREVARAGGLDAEIEAAIRGRLAGTSR
jgi:thiol-disulfide isomerase/thioredoxin